MVIVTPSILSADFANLERDMDVIRNAGAPWAHVDVMDGHFVPNITVGLPVVKALRRVSDLTLDVHLMISEPGKYAEAFCKAGADYLTVHLEADTPEKIRQTLESIRAMGAKTGLAIKPGTPVESLESYLPLCDMILVMTVEPGFGGQSFMENMMEKLRYLRGRLEVCNPGYLLQVDGGVDLRTGPICKAAGANVLVSGSAFFKAADKADFVARLSAEE